MVERFGRDAGIPIPQDIFRLVKGLENIETGGETFIEILPGNEERVFQARVAKVNLQVNFLSRLKYPDNQVSRGMIGKLGRQQYVEITLREPADRATRFVNEYVCFYPLSRYQTDRLGIGSLVGCYLSPHRLPNGTDVWIASDVHRIDVSGKSELPRDEAIAR